MSMASKTNWLLFHSRVYFVSHTTVLSRCAYLSTLVESPLQGSVLSPYLLGNALLSANHHEMENGMENLSALFPARVSFISYKHLFDLMYAHLTATPIRSGT